MALATLSVLLCVTAGAKEHSVVVFACQTHGLCMPSNWRAHNFATWIEVEDGEVTQRFTISWMPVGRIRCLSDPELGRNRTLEETIDRYTRKCVVITKWGPYRITDEFFASARRQHESLEESEVTGAMKWKFFDSSTRCRCCEPAVNCVHAVSDACGVMLRTCHRYGESAATAIVAHFCHQGMIVENEATHDAIWKVILGGAPDLVDADRCPSR